MPRSAQARTSAGIAAPTNAGDTAIEASSGAPCAQPKPRSTVGWMTFQPWIVSTMACPCAPDRRRQQVRQPLEEDGRAVVRGARGDSDRRRCGRGGRLMSAEAPVAAASSSRERRGVQVVHLERRAAPWPPHRSRAGRRAARPARAGPIRERRSARARRPRAASSLGAAWGLPDAGGAQRPHCWKYRTNTSCVTSASAAHTRGGLGEDAARDRPPPRRRTAATPARSAAVR